MSEQIIILLATYNGAPYLSDQLESLFSQTDQNWRLVVRDDGSTDNTRSILESWRCRYPDRIVIIEDQNGCLGPRGNFANLLESAETLYVMFCDQDDVWLPDKVELTLQKMREMEALHGTDLPLLVHTDLKVVGRFLEPVADSLWRWQRTNPRAIKLNRLLVQNNATGCTMMINRALRDLACPIHQDARMHDWWLMLVAGTFGHIDCLDHPTLLYRQHGANDSGAVQIGLATELRKVFNKAIWLAALEERELLAANLRLQATAFLERYRDRLDDGKRKMIEAYLLLGSQGFFLRRYTILKYRFFYGSWLVNLGMLLFR